MSDINKELQTLLAGIKFSQDDELYKTGFLANRLYMHANLSALKKMLFLHIKSTTGKTIKELEAEFQQLSDQSFKHALEELVSEFGVEKDPSEAS